MKSVYPWHLKGPKVNDPIINDPLGKCKTNQSSQCNRLYRWLLDRHMTELNALRPFHKRYSPISHTCQAHLTSYNVNIYWTFWPFVSLLYFAARLSSPTLAEWRIHHLRGRLWGRDCHKRCLYVVVVSEPFHALFSSIITALWPSPATSKARLARCSNTQCPHIVGAHCLRHVG